jgi:plastocyanin
VARALLTLVLAAALAALPLAAALTPSTATGAPVSIMATSSWSFQPNTFTVTPGDTVHLVVTQLASFLHTFTLSSVANYDFPSSSTSADLSSYFTAHPPIVNLTLGSTAGVRFYANFTAPGPGSYEFVCLQPTHFAAGMYGHMISSSGGGTSSSSAFPVNPWALLVVLVALVAIGLAVYVLYPRRPRPVTA